MHVHEAIRSRRAIKGFDPEFKLTPAQRDELLTLAIQAPTAYNLQHWRLVVVEDPELRKQIRAAAWDQSQITDASLLVILTGDLASWSKNAARVWHDAPEPVRDFMVPAIGAYYEGKLQTQRDEVMRSAGILGQTLMLAARGMGLDSCPMDGFDFDAVAKLIHLPADHAIAFIVTIGRKTREPWPKPGQLPLSEVVIHNRF